MATRRVLSIPLRWRVGTPIIRHYSAIVGTVRKKLETTCRIVSMSCMMAMKVSLAIGFVGVLHRWYKVLWSYPPKTRGWNRVARRPYEA
jgi:hypothetical protein